MVKRISAVAGGAPPNKSGMKVEVRHRDLLTRQTVVFDEAGAALREARRVIDETAPNAKSYPARLVDFNNDPTTTWAAVQKFLQIVEERFAKQLAEKPVNK